jgi:hypothetical protein
MIFEIGRLRLVAMAGNLREKPSGPGALRLQMCEPGDLLVGVLA